MERASRILSHFRARFNSSASKTIRRISSSSRAAVVPATPLAHAYQSEHRRSLENPAAFWADKATHIEWFQPPPAATVLTRDANGIHRWFKGGSLNAAYLATEMPARTRGSQAALIYDSPVTGQKRTLLYSELDEQVGRMAHVLKTEFGVTKGDIVAIYMPMIPEAVVAMLATARLGAIHSVVFGGFAPTELVSRFAEARPKLVVTASGAVEVDKVIAYQPLVDAALALYGQPQLPVLCVHRPELNRIGKQSSASASSSAPPAVPAPLSWPAHHHCWSALMQKHAGQRAAAVPCDATHPLYVLYTSGSTGKPKGIPRDHGSIVALKYSMEAVMSARPGSVYWAASDVGWVVGHSYCVYGPLVHGCTTLIYEGKPVRTPDAGAFWRVISEHKVESVFAAPTAWRAIRKEDPECALMQRPGVDIACLKNVFLAGERLDPSTLQWLQRLLPGRGILDNWWQTETGWPVCANPIGLAGGALPVKPGSSTVPMPGYDVQILDETGKRVGAGVTGEICIKLPLPPSCLYTVWQNHARFESSYLSAFPGYYQTGDGGYIDADGYLFIMGRTDDVINVAAHRLSTGEMEEIIATHARVAECAVFGVADALKGEVPVGLIVLKDAANQDQSPAAAAASHAQIYAELVALVRARIGAIASFRHVFVVKRLPKTRSGKILRATIRKMTTNAAVPPPSTIDDPAILDEIREVLKANKIGPLYAPAL